MQDEHACSKCCQKYVAVFCPVRVFWPIRVWYKCYTTHSDGKEGPVKLNFRKGNYQAICEELDTVNWNDLLQGDCIDTNWDLFKYRVLSVANNHIPKAAKKSANNRPPWWSSRLSKAVKEKQDLFLKYKFTLSLDDYAK